jgi:hypothetical protein
VARIQTATQQLLQNFTDSIPRQSRNDSAAPARPPTSISIPNSSQSGEKRTFLVLLGHRCARCCTSHKHRWRKSLYLKALSLAPNVHKKKRARLV